MIERNVENRIKDMAMQFKAITITGPRQSGKTTLARSLFADYRYVSLEDLDIRQFASEDPRGFLKQYDTYTIIDEVQRVPELLSYLQTKLDENKENAQYILTGSQNFLLSKQVSQTLVGRTSLTTLLPLTLDEIRKFNKVNKQGEVHKAMIGGSYPGVYDRRLDFTSFYSSYVSLYLERDVRDLRTIDNLSRFQRFLTLCAGRAGQILNMTDLSGALGVDSKTIDAWIGVLEASYIAYRLRPYSTNLPKRLRKMPKLYFYDTGILCYLLNIRTQDELTASHFYGNIFENFVISELIKYQTNNGEQPRLYFIRDQYGEVDCVFETPSGGLAIAEIKAASTYVKEYSAKVSSFGDSLDIPENRRYLIYMGTNQSRKNITLINASDIPTVFL